MWVSKREWDELKGRVFVLENQGSPPVKKLEFERFEGAREAHGRTWAGSDLSHDDLQCIRNYYYFAVSIHDAIRRILEHLGLEFKYEDETPAKITLVKKAAVKEVE